MINPLNADDLARAILATVPMIGRMLRTEIRGAREHLSPGHFALLNMLAFEPLTQTELAERLQVSASTMSATIATLVKRGWIAQARSDEDRRVVLIAITEEGIAALRSIDRESVESIRAMIAPLTPGERAQLFAGLSILHKLFTEAPPERPEGDEPDVRPFDPRHHRGGHHRRHRRHRHHGGMPPFPREGFPPGFMPTPDFLFRFPPEGFPPKGFGWRGRRFNMPVPPPVGEEGHGFAPDAPPEHPMHGRGRGRRRRGMRGFPTDMEMPPSDKPKRRPISDDVNDDDVV